MAFFERFSTLLRADAHGALDALEDRRLVLRQHLRDAEEALAAKKARRQGLDAELRDLERAASRLEVRRDDLERDVDLALAEDRDDLARFAIQQLLPLRRRLEELAERRRELERRTGELDEVLERQEAQLDDLRLRVRAALERERDLEGDPWLHGAAERVAEEDVEMELLRRRTASRDETSGESGEASGEVAP